MDFLTGVLILLACAKILGVLVEYAGYPSLIGEIIAGIILGPSIFNIIEVNQVILLFSHIGVILLLFITGVEINLKIFRSAQIQMFSTGLVGASIPFVLGFILGTLLSLPFGESFFLAITFMLTSIGISVRTLMEKQQLNTEFGMTIVGGAVVCAVIGIISFGILSSVSSTGIITPDIVLRPLAIAFFFIMFFLMLGKKVFLFVYERVKNYHNSSLTYSLIFLIACLSAVGSQRLGLTLVIGAFLAGIILNKSVHEDHTIHQSLHNMGFGIFITLFFASVGLMMEFRVTEILSPFIFLVILVAVLSKILGGFLGSYPFLKDRDGAFLVGIGMIPRGDLTLALGQSAIIAGIISQQTYISVVLMVLTTVLLTPIFLTLWINHMEKIKEERLAVR